MFLSSSRNHVTVVLHINCLTVSHKEVFLAVKCETNLLSAVLGATIILDKINGTPGPPLPHIQ